MKTIRKYELDPTKKHQEFRMPTWADTLDVQLQHGIPVFWATVDTDTPMEDRRFLLLHTDEEVSGYPTYVGTLQIGTEAFHLFEEFDDELPF